MRLNRIILIGCGKAKRQERSPAASLYTGSLFSAAREYAESSGVSWYILSALHGLLEPDTDIQPYEETLKGKTVVNRAAWHVGVVAQLLDQLPDFFYSFRDCTLEVHAGIAYREPLMPIFRELGFSCHSPTEKFQIGQRIAWFKEEARKNRIMRGLESDSIPTVGNEYRARDNLLHTDNAHRPRARVFREVK